MTRLECTHQLKEALGCCIVISSLICQVVLAGTIHTFMSKGHEATDGPTQVSLQGQET